MKQTNPSIQIRILNYGIIAILAIAPFYTTMSIWLASHLHHSDLIKIGEEGLLAALIAMISIFLVTHKEYLHAVMRSYIFILSCAFIALVLLIGIYDLATVRVARNAVIYGWLTDLRPIGIFLLALLTSSLATIKGEEYFPWKKTVMIPAVIVIIFGFLQFSVLPKDILRHVGYSFQTTAPYQTVDNQPSLIRIQSTLRGANPFGVYLSFIITLIAAWFLFEKKYKNKLFLGGFIILSLLVLYHTYSRSAEVGLLLSLFTLLGLYNKKFLLRHAPVVIAVVVVVASFGVYEVHRRNYLAQNIIFHSSNKSSSRLSSNSQRAQALETGVKDVINYPMGTGVGSAGPASRRNTLGPTRISENSFLQIGQEVGVLGLVLFISINALVAYELWLGRRQVLPLLLLSSFIGITFAGMVSHVWADDTIAYIWWGLAGIAVAPVIIGDRSKPTNDKKHKKRTAQTSHPIR